MILGNLWAEKSTNLTNQSTNSTISVTNIDDIRQNILTNADSLSPFSAIFIFSINAGINFFILDKEDIIAKYNLNQLQNTVSISFHIQLGLVLQYYWMVTLNYGYSKREDYHYKDNYFSINARSLESRYHHYLQFDVDYFLWNYMEDKNISFGLGFGWVRRNIFFSTIGDVTSGNEILSSELIFQKNSVMMTPQTKFYYRLSENGTIYIGFRYNFIFPDFENYPELLFGIDVNLDLTPRSEDNRNPFFEDEIKPAETSKNPPINRSTKNKGGVKKEVQTETKKIYDTIRQDP